MSDPRPGQAEFRDLTIFLHETCYRGELQRAGGLFESPDPQGSRIFDPRVPNHGVVMDDGAFVWLGEYVQAWFANLLTPGGPHEAAKAHVRTQIHNSDEARQKRGDKPPVPPVPPLPGTFSPLAAPVTASRDGFVDALGHYVVPRMRSYLYGLTDEVWALGEGHIHDVCRQAVALGFQVLTVFAGALSQTPGGQFRPFHQGPEDVPLRLARLTDIAWVQYSLLVLPIAVTDSGEIDYNPENQVRAVARTMAANPRRYFGLECVNEINNPTQRRDLNVGQLMLAAREAGWTGLLSPGTWLGRNQDELDEESMRYSNPGGDYTALALQRGKAPYYREASRIKEGWEIQRVHGNPILQREPEKVDTYGPNTVAFASLLGLQAALFGQGICFHSTQARNAAVLSGLELEAAQAMIASLTAMASDGPYDFINNQRQNANAGSPVVAGAFEDEGTPHDDFWLPGGYLWRAYSGRRGNEGRIVLSGRDVWHDPTFDGGVIRVGNGWQGVGVADFLGGVVVAIRRG